MSDKELCKLLLFKEFNPINNDVAKTIFELETVNGFPLELSLEILDLKDNEDIFYITDEYLRLKTKHSLNSGMEFMGKSHIKMIENNKRILKELWQK